MSRACGRLCLKEEVQFERLGVARARVANRAANGAWCFFAGVRVGTLNVCGGRCESRYASGGDISVGRFVRLGELHLWPSSSQRKRSILWLSQ